MNAESCRRVICGARSLPTGIGLASSPSFGSILRSEGHMHCTTFALHQVPVAIRVFLPGCNCGIVLEVQHAAVLLVFI